MDRSDRSSAGGRPSARTAAGVFGRTMEKYALEGVRLQMHTRYVQVHRSRQFKRWVDGLVVDAKVGDKQTDETAARHGARGSAAPA
jgi:hypothetical protein